MLRQDLLQALENIAHEENRTANEIVEEFVKSYRQRKEIAVGKQPFSLFGLPRDSLLIFYFIAMLLLTVGGLYSLILGIEAEIFDESIARLLSIPLAGFIMIIPAIGQMYRDKQETIKRKILSQQLRQEEPELFAMFDEIANDFGQDEN